MKRDRPRHVSKGRTGPRLVRLLMPALAVVAAVAAVVASHGDASPASGDGVAREAHHRKAGRLEVAAAGKRTGAVVPERPRRAVLPSGRKVVVRPVSTMRDGTLDLPSDIEVSGWWRGGSRLGDPFGSVLLSAHVDSATQGLGPYAELLSVRRGQSVVLTSTHLRQEYVVRSLRLVHKGTLSRHPGIYSAAGPHRLTLVTCAGPYVRSKGGYQRLAVVTARAVSRPTRRGA